MATLDDLSFLQSARGRRVRSGCDEMDRRGRVGARVCVRTCDLLVHAAEAGVHGDEARGGKAVCVFVRRVL